LKNTLDGRLDGEKGLKVGGCSQYIQPEAKMKNVPLPIVFLTLSSGVYKGLV
jgi:hypothetical protein